MSRALAELAQAFAAGATDPAGVRRTPTLQPEGLRLLCLPHARRPRLLLPTEHPRSAAAAVRRFSESGPGWATRAAQVAALGISVGLLRRHSVGPFTLTLGQGADSDLSLLSYLSQVVGQELTVAVRMTPHRPNSKPVLLLLSMDGRVLGYAKVGVNPLTRALVRHEACALAGFGDDERERLGFDIPRIMKHDSWPDVELLVVTALRAGRGSRRDPHPDAMRAIAGRRGLDYTPFATSRFRTQTQARLARLQMSNASVVALTDAWQVICDRLGEQRLLFGGSHGDWTPWNVCRSAGRLSVWDWERSATDAPVGLDAAHHLIMVANHRRRLEDRVIRRLVGRAEPVVSDLGQASRHAPALVMLALLEMALRFEEARAAGVAVTNRFTPLLASAVISMSEPAQNCSTALGTPPHAT